MKIIEKTNLFLEEKEVLRQLWNNEYPARISYETIEDFDLYLNGLENINHYLLIDDSGEINGWGFTFIRNDENWFAIILDHKIQGKGYGSILIDEMKMKSNSLNGWVIDGKNEVKQNKDLYKSPILFYVKEGFTICSEIRIENEKISGVKINWTQKKNTSI